MLDRSAKFGLSTPLPQTPPSPLRRNLLGGAAPPALWTPANMVTHRWFDFSDPLTITLSGSNITQINDKSGNAGHATQGTVVLQPVAVAASLNSLDVGRFTNDMLAFPLSTVDGWSVFTVHKANSATSHQMLLGEIDSFIPIGIPGDLGTNMIRIDGVNDTPAPTWHADGSLQAPTTRSDTHAIIATDAWRIVSISGLRGSISTYYIGNDNGGNQLALDGDLAQMIILPSVPSAANREKLEGWAAHKYGLTSLLPGGHPFKTSPPTV